MVATVTKTVKSSGGDYTSLKSWESGQQADLVAADEIRVAECYDFSDTVTTSTLAVSGWTTDATRFIRITVPVAEQHDGRARAVSGTGYELIPDFTNSRVIIIAEDYTEMIGVVINNGAGVGGVEIWASNVTFKKCISHNSPTGIQHSFWVGSGSATAINCLSYDYNENGFSAMTCDHCTAHGGANGGIGFKSCTTRNCVAGSNSWKDYENVTSQTTDASEDTTGTAGLQSLVMADQFTNLTAGSEDFSLKSGSNLEGAATDINLADDIIGTTRDATAADIGAFEFVAAAGANPHGPLGHPLHGPFGGPIGA